MGSVTAKCSFADDLGDDDSVSLEGLRDHRFLVLHSLPLAVDMVMGLQFLEEAETSAEKRDRCTGRSSTSVEVAPSDTPYTKTGRRRRTSEGFVCYGDGNWYSRSWRIPDASSQPESSNSSSMSAWRGLRASPSCHRPHVADTSFWYACEETMEDFPFAFKRCLMALVDLNEPRWDHPSWVPRCKTFYGPPPIVDIINRLVGTAKGLFRIPVADQVAGKLRAVSQDLLQLLN